MGHQITVMNGERTKLHLKDWRPSIFLIHIPHNVFLWLSEIIQRGPFSRHNKWQNHNKFTTQNGVKIVDKITARHGRKKSLENSLKGKLHMTNHDYFLTCIFQTPKCHFETHIEKGLLSAKLK